MKIHPTVKPVALVAEAILVRIDHVCRSFSGSRAAGFFSSSSPPRCRAGAARRALALRLIVLTIAAPCQWADGTSARDATKAIVFLAVSLAGVVPAALIP